MDKSQQCATNCTLLESNVTACSVHALLYLMIYIVSCVLGYDVVRNPYTRHILLHV